MYAFVFCMCEFFCFKQMQWTNKRWNWYQNKKHQPKKKQINKNETVRRTQAHKSIQMKHEMQAMAVVVIFSTQNKTKFWMNKMHLHYWWQTKRNHWFKSSKLHLPSRKSPASISDNSFAKLSKPSFWESAFDDCSLGAVGFVFQPYLL